MSDDGYSREARDLTRFYCDSEGQIRGLVAPAQDYEGLAVVSDGGVADHERRMTDKVLRLVSFDREILAALAKVGAHHRRALERCYREVMRSHGASGHQTIMRAPFGLAGGAARRAEPLNGNWAHREIAARGCGNLADMVAAAIGAHAGERTRLEIGAWVDRLGLRLQRDRCTPGERDLGRLISAECEDLERRALSVFRRARSHLPMRVRLAGLGGLR